MKKQVESEIPVKISTPAEHRGLMIAAMEALISGKINVKIANALASLSAEVHKSIAQEWDMRVYAAENLGISGGRIVRMLDNSEVN